MRIKIGRLELNVECGTNDCCGTGLWFNWHIKPRPPIPHYIPTSEEIMLRRFQMTDEYLDIIAPLPKDAA